jgi:cellulose synthase/poly-beta-1,6-N-acetylglucosamine synthase-like glycosyltransferase
MARQEVPMLASILIKSNDQRKYLAQTYEILARQTVEDFEIILLYSGKPGCTPLAPTDLACRIVRIIPEEFSHPGALNIGAKVAAGQYLVCLSADAVPASEEWLKSLLEPFDCPYVAGVFGRHLFRKEGNIIDRWKLWLRYPARSLCRWGQGNYIFSNANSAIRRTRWESRSFDEAVRECEDYEWMRWILYSLCRGCCRLSHARRNVRVCGLPEESYGVQEPPQAH